MLHSRGSGDPMEARNLIGSSFGPAHLRVIFKAFDEAWLEIAPHVSNHPDAIQAARMKLANCAIELFKECGRTTPMC